MAIVAMAMVLVTAGSGRPPGGYGGAKTANPAPK
jgi:hypothetical protein